MNSTFPLQGRLPAALVLTISMLIGGTTIAHATTTHHGHGLSIAPAGLVSAIAQTQEKEAAKDPAYRIATNGCASLKTGPKGKSLTSCFTNTGPSFTQGKNKINLHLVAWGSKGKLHPVSLHRTTPKVNRITYQGKNINEWWRVLPMGYEQGFTINEGPKDNGNIVLQLKTNRTPTIHHNTLAWGNLHYGKLRVIDAKGKTLPSHLTAHGKTVTLAFDASHAQFPVTVDPMVWFQQTFADPAATAADEFGAAVALSSDGATALVGAVGTNSYAGSAYIFTQSGGSWSMIATFADPAATANDNFGGFVALSGNGTTALVGASGTSSGGAAYVFTQGASGWSGVTSPTATFADPGAASYDQFGSSVAMDNTGATALVGANVTNSGAGVAYIYTQGASGWSGVTSPTATFDDPGTASDYFGFSLALSGDGATALVGAVGTNSKAGAAYVYTQGASGWSGVTAPTATFGDPAATAKDWFGSSVALDSTGTTALVGAPKAPYDSTASTAGPGEAYLFIQGGGSWVTTPAATFTDPAAVAGDGFGSVVAISGDGTTALVGADRTSSFAGAAYVYTQGASGWGGVNSPATTFTDPATTAGGDYFGNSVAIDSTGSTALIGAFAASGFGGAYSYTTPSNLSATLTVPAKVDTSTQYDAVYSITNSSTSTSADVQVQLPVPSGATYVSVTSSPGSCTYDSTTQIATCDLGTISGGSGSTSATLTLNSGATKGITLTQTASLTNGSPNLAQSASTSVSGGGGGGALGLWSLLGLLGLAGFGRRIVRRTEDS